MVMDRQINTLQCVSETHAKLLDAARDILRRNDRGGYTVPTDALYPFQWNWDSAFCAMGFATFDIDRALTELEFLYSGQWASGLVPHIIFHRDADTYFPGPQVWGTHQTPPTSGISQPPVTASALAYILDMASTGPANLGPESDVMGRARALYEKILAYHHWWATERDPDGSGIVALLHPWESGSDNSPVWDEALGKVPATQTPFQRRDVALVDSDMRPRQWEYDRYIYLVELYRTLGWQGDRMWSETPFKVADVGLNAILMRDELDLIALAERFDDPANAQVLRARAARRRQGFDKLWSPERGLYLSRDLLRDRLVDVPSHASFLPLWAGTEPFDRAASLASELARWINLSRFGVPTIAPDDAEFDQRRYWRGPVWGIINWMISEGLRRHGFTKLADEIKGHTAALIQNSGFSEYFDPITGEGLGGGDFSWTAAVGLAWALD